MRSVRSALAKVHAAIMTVPGIRIQHHDHAAPGVVSTRPLLPRMWELRGHVWGYDAAYVALAETYGCLPVTSDARLARSPGLRCAIRLALQPTGWLAAVVVPAGGDPHVGLSDLVDQPVLIGDAP